MQGSQHHSQHNYEWWDICERLGIVKEICLRVSDVSGSNRWNLFAFWMEARCSTTELTSHIRIPLNLCIIRYLPTCVNCIWYPRRDLNPHLLDLKSSASSSWATRAWCELVPVVGFEPTLSRVWVCCLCQLGYTGITIVVCYIYYTWTHMSIT